LRSLIGSIPGGLEGTAMQRLSDIGVSYQKNGTLAVDSAKLSAAITSDISGVANLVAAYGSAFKSATDTMVGSGGILAARTDGITASIKSLNKQADVVSARLAQIEARYRKQFTALDTLMSNMTKTSNFLTQQLANLPTLNDSSN
jgi:flagellar hook-associated protein 2